MGERPDRLARDLRCTGNVTELAKCDYCLPAGGRVQGEPGIIVVLRSHILVEKLGPVIAPALSEAVIDGRVTRMASIGIQTLSTYPV